MRLRLKKVVKFLDRVTNLVEIIICLFLMLLSIYCLYDAKMLFDSANDSSLLRYKPGYDQTEKDDREILKEYYVAWLTINDTGIDYPVMQGSTNDDFINMDPYGDYSLSGSIFLDYRNSKDFSDPYNLVYGHHMEHGFMFGALDKYTDIGFFKKHRSGTLSVQGNEYAYRICAVLESDATQEEIFAPTEIDKEEVIDYIKENAIHLEEEFMTLSESSQILALSTCQSPSSIRRTVVIGILIDNR